jgi:hypothetical protein
VSYETIPGRDRALCCEYGTCRTVSVNFNPRRHVPEEHSPEDLELHAHRCAGTRPLAAVAPAARRRQVRHLRAENPTRVAAGPRPRGRTEPRRGGELPLRTPRRHPAGCLNVAEPGLHGEFIVFLQRAQQLAEELQRRPD